MCYVASHQEFISLEEERCILDIENAKLKKEVLLLQKEILTLQKQRVLDLSLTQPLESFFIEFWTVKLFNYINFIYY